MANSHDITEFQKGRVAKDEFVVKHGNNDVLRKGAMLNNPDVSNKSNMQGYARLFESKNGDSSSVSASDNKGLQFVRCEQADDIKSGNSENLISSNQIMNTDFLDDVKENQDQLVNVYAKPRDAVQKLGNGLSSLKTTRINRLNRKVSRSEFVVSKADKLANFAKNHNANKASNVLKNLGKKQQVKNAKRSNKVAKLRKSKARRGKQLNILTFGKHGRSKLVWLVQIVLPVILSFLLIAGIMGAVVGVTSAFQQQQNISTSDVEKKIALYLRDKGFSNEAIAGVLGNGKAESGNDPAKEQVGGGGYGIWQFDGGNKANYIAYVNGTGIGGVPTAIDPWNMASVNNQLYWVFGRGGVVNGWDNGRLFSTGYYDVLKGVGGWDGNYYSDVNDFKTGNNVITCTVSFFGCYERGATGDVAHLDLRIQYAQEYLGAIESGSIFSDSDVVNRATAEIGKPYVWGAVGPDAYDCSGLVSYCLTGRHERIGNTSTFMRWPRVDDPQAGDVLVSNSHCAIYIGNGRMIHAGSPQTGVEETSTDWFLAQGAIFVRYMG